MHTHTLNTQSTHVCYNNADLVARIRLSGNVSSRRCDQPLGGIYYYIPRNRGQYIPTRCCYRGLVQWVYDVTARRPMVMPLRSFIILQTNHRGICKRCGQRFYDFADSRWAVDDEICSFLLLFSYLFFVITSFCVRYNNILYTVKLCIHD